MEKEEQRIDVLKSYAILDSGPEDEFDEITALAAYFSKLDAKGSVPAGVKK